MQQPVLRRLDLRPAQQIAIITVSGVPLSRLDQKACMRLDVFQVQRQCLDQYVDGCVEKLCVRPDAVDYPEYNFTGIYELALHYTNISIGGVTCSRGFYYYDSTLT